MSRFAAFLLLGWFFLFLQAGPVPLFFPDGFKPDLLLLLVVYLGLREPPLRGGCLAMLLGCLMDVFAGRTLGLNGLVLLLLFLAVRVTADRVNTESPLLMVLMAGLGTLSAGLIQAFLLGYFAGQEGVWALIIRRLPAQIVINLIAVFLLMGAVRWLEGILAPKLSKLGLWPKKRLT